MRVRIFERGNKLINYYITSIMYITVDSIYSNQTSGFVKLISFTVDIFISGQLIVDV